MKQARLKNRLSSLKRRIAFCTASNAAPSTIRFLKNNLELDSNSTTTHIEIQGVSNGWAYIIARLYIFDGNDFDNPDGCAATVIKEYTGYVKIIGKYGIPNIWYAHTSY